MSRTPTALHLLRDLLLLMDEGEEVEARSVNIEEKRWAWERDPKRMPAVGDAGRTTKIVHINLIFRSSAAV